MVLVLQHQMTPIQRKLSEVMSQSSFLILCNSLYLNFYNTLTPKIMGWDKHVFLVCGCGIEFSQCWEQTNKAVKSVCKCSLGTGTSTAYFKRRNTQSIQTTKQQFTLTGNIFCFSVRVHGVNLLPMYSLASGPFFVAQSVAVNPPVTCCLWSDIFHWRHLFHPVIPFLSFLSNV